MKAALIFFFALTFGTARGQDSLRKIYYQDEEFNSRSIEAYYVGCQELISDTAYELKYDLRSKGEWKSFFDNTLQTVQGHYFTRSDTSFSISYYRNGQKKEENREYGNVWIYSGKWCENGQLISQGNPNDMSYRNKESYYCNGKIEWQGGQAYGRNYGTIKTWYENGQLRSEKTYTVYNPELKSESRLISERYWDGVGKEVSSLQTDKIRKNTLGAPIRISPDKLNGLTAYYQIKGQADYDNQMTKLKSEIYKIAKLENPCRCKVGLVYIIFTVTAEGLIEGISITQSLETAADETFVKALTNMGKWTPGLIEGIPVDVKVEVAFELEKIK